MTEDDLTASMKYATESAVALVTVMQSGDSPVLDGQLTSIVEWIGLAPESPEGRRTALQLNQSAHLTTLCIELLAKSSDLTVSETTQRLAARIMKFNQD
jgi:hypothetical protein